MRWTPADDDLLISQVQNYIHQFQLARSSTNTSTDEDLVIDWKMIAKKFPGRTPKQCREHYWGSVNPENNKDPWTPEEILLVENLIQIHGTQWKIIRSLLPTHRSELAIRNMYYATQRKQARAQAKQGRKLAVSMRQIRNNIKNNNSDMVTNNNNNHNNEELRGDYTTFISHSNQSHHHPSYYTNEEEEDDDKESKNNDMNNDKDEDEENNHNTDNSLTTLSTSSSRISSSQSNHHQHHHRHTPSNTNYPSSPNHSYRYNQHHKELLSTSSSTITNTINTSKYNHYYPSNNTISSLSSAMSTMPENSISTEPNSSNMSNLPPRLTIRPPTEN